MNTDQIINKWKYIIDSIGYNGSKLKELCLYAENSSNKPSDIGKFFPLSLKILCKLKSLDNPNVTFTCFDNKQFLLNENRNGKIESLLNSEGYSPISSESYLKIDISNITIQSIYSHSPAATAALQFLPADTVQEIENILIQMTIDKLDKELDSDNPIVFNTGNLVKDISEASGGMQFTLDYIIR